MYRDAYNLLREILDDEQLNQYIFKETGKHLAVIEAGAKITAPCASIHLNGGSFSRKSNSGTEIDYLVSFALPFWGADAFTRCIDFIDFAIPIFFEYRDRHNFILKASPSINEVDEEASQLWTVEILFTVSAFL